MEEDQENKHICKFCGRSFPNGRALGGHSRSHMTKNSSEVEENLDKKKHDYIVNDGKKGSNHELGFESGAHTGYGLRENRKKTWRIADSVEDSSLHSKFCKDCGKGFQSEKALFGHMKCHSEKEKNSNESSEEENSWSIASQSGNRKKRSQRRRTRYIATTAATSSSFSIVNNSSSVTEEEQEEGEVALCLMMLSRDVTHLGLGFISVEESSENSSVFVASKPEGKENSVAREKKLDEKTSESKMIESEVTVNGVCENYDKNKNPTFFEVDEVELGKSLTKESDLEFGSHQWHRLRKRKSRDSRSMELESDSSRKRTSDDLDFELCKTSTTKIKFECTTCNKVFPSYQALGGHKASHKKLFVCFEVENKPKCPSRIPIDFTEKTNGIILGQKKTRAHECPICLKVFPSGQALGGHKRSHVIQKDLPPPRELLDLNLPAPIEEEDNNAASTYYIRNNDELACIIRP